MAMVKYWKLIQDTDVTHSLTWPNDSQCNNSRDFEGERLVRFDKDNWAGLVAVILPHLHFTVFGPEFSVGIGLIVSRSF